MDIVFLKDFIDYGILGLLIFLGFVSIFFYIERLLYFRSVKVNEFDKKEKLQLNLTNNTSIVASIASNSVYIGLLGTVLGILVTFYEMGNSGQIDVKIIMTSLAFALKATALGLVVAIPSMIFYNHLVRRVEVLETQWDIEQ